MVGVIGLARVVGMVRLTRIIGVVGLARVVGMVRLTRMVGVVGLARMVGMVMTFVELFIGNHKLDSSFYLI